jgi:hypothetical protein
MAAVTVRLASAGVLAAAAAALQMFIMQAFLLLLVQVAVAQAAIAVLMWTVEATAVRLPVRLVAVAVQLPAVQEAIQSPVWVVHQVLVAHAPVLEVLREARE